MAWGELFNAAVVISDPPHHSIGGLMMSNIDVTADE